MPITEVQRKTGKFVGTAQATTALDAPTTAGNTVVIALASVGTISIPSGFTRASPTSGGSNLGIYYKATAGGETSWTVGPSASNPTRYDVFEFAGMDPDFPVDVSTSAAFNASGSSGTSPRSTTYDGLALAVHSLIEGASGTTHTFSGQTNGFVEQTDDAIANGTTNASSMTTSWKTVQSLAAFETAVTQTPSGGIWRNTIVVFTAEGAKRDPNIPYFWGFSQQLSGYPASHTASVLATNPAPYWEGQTGAPTIDSDGLRLQGSGSIQNVQGLGISTQSTARAALARVRLRINSVTGDLEVVKVNANTATDHAVLTWRSASQKLELKLSSGSAVLSDQTVAADGSAWVDVDLRVVGTTTAFTADWRVNYGSGWVDQTPATSTAPLTLTSWKLILGWAASSTGNVSYDYAACSVTAGHYPLGDYTVVFLGPDPAGTPTTTNTALYRRFTANGTLDGAFSASSIRDAVEDWPPTVGGSADGVACVTAASGVAEALLVPMDTYPAAANGGSVRVARAVVPVWAASTSTSALEVRGTVDGTPSGAGATTLYAMADPNADTSSTPPWLCKIWRPTDGWSQAYLDAAQLLVHTTSAVDIGPHALGLEVLIKTATTELLFGDTGAVPRVEQVFDPGTGGLVSVQAYTGSEGLEVEYEVNGTPDSWSVPADSNPAVRILDAPDMATVNRMTARPG